MTRPPRFFELLLRVICRGDIGADVAADLAEEFAERVRDCGGVAARRWYRRQALRSTAMIAMSDCGGTLRRVARTIQSAPRLMYFRGDIRPALRSLRRAPWYAVTCAAVMALTLGLATTVFAVLDGVLFKPLPYARPAELVQVVPGWKAGPGNGVSFIANVSWPDLRAWREAAPDIAFGAARVGGVARISETDRLRSAQIDRGFLDLLGVRPAIGGFDPSDFTSASAVVPGLITDAAWRARFGADRGVVGRRFDDGNGGGLRIVGVLPAGFVFPHWFARIAPEVLTPIPDVPGPRDDDPRVRQFHVIARVPPARRAATQSRLDRAVAMVAAAFPPQAHDPEMSATRRITSGPFDRIGLEPLDEALTRRSGLMAATAFAAAMALVLLGGLNLAGLTGGRTLDRQREMTLRRSLGARGVDLVRTLAVEQAILVGSGALAGLLLAQWWISVIASLLPADVTFLKTPTIDTRVVIFAVLAAAASAAVVTAWGARPALSARARVALADAGGTTSRSQRYVMRALVGTEIALAFVVALGGALFASSFAAVWSVDHGLRLDDAARIQVRFAHTGMPAIRSLLGTIRRVPGVAAAGGVGGPFLDRAIAGSSFDPPDGARRIDGDVEQIRITAGTAAALGLRLLEGRLPADDELDRGARVVAVSRTVARAYFPSRPAVGQMIVSRGVPFEIVGVVDDIRQRALDMESSGEIYSPLAYESDPGLSNVVVASASGALDDTLPAVTEAVARGHEDVRVVKAETMREALGATVQTREFQTWLFVSFAVAGLMIAAVGVFGMVAMSVSRRAREMGVRIALGSTRRGVVWLMLREVLPPVGIGAALGGLLAWWASGFIASSLYQVTPHDWRAWISTAVVLVGASVIAVLGPARRASAVDPVTVLRAD